MMNDYARTVLAPADQDVLVAAGRGGPCRAPRLRTRPAAHRHQGQDVPPAPSAPGSSVAALSTPSWRKASSPRARTVARRPGCSSRESWGPAPCGGAPATRWRDVYQSGEWLALAGEAGVGKQAILRAVHQRRNPSSRFNVLDATDATEPGWLAGARTALLEDVGGDNAGTVIIRHVDRLDGVHLRSLAATLQEAANGDKQQALLGRRDLRRGRCEQGARAAAATVPEHGGGPAAAPPRRGHPGHSCRSSSRVSATADS